jgi:hypothetical protein
MLSTFNCIILLQNIFQISRKTHIKCVAIKIVKLWFLLMYTVPWKHPCFGPSLQYYMFWTYPYIFWVLLCTFGAWNGHLMSIASPKHVEHGPKICLGDIHPFWEKVDGGKGKQWRKKKAIWFLGESTLSPPKIVFTSIFSYN